MHTLLPCRNAVCCRTLNRWGPWNGVSVFSGLGGEGWGMRHPARSDPSFDPRLLPFSLFRIRFNFTTFQVCSKESRVNG